MFSLVPYANPFKTLTTELDSWLDDVNFGAPITRKPRDVPVDVEEYENHYLVSADLPGMKKEDISINVENGILTIKGEKKKEEKHQKGKTSYYERRYGAFQRSFRLDDTLNGDKIEASYKDGVLNVSIPKKEKVKPKAIEIK